MKSILEELYMGNIGFDSGAHAPDSPFAKAVFKKHDCMERLTATLNDSEKILFDAYCDAAGEMEDISRYGAFERALKFGMLLMAEVFKEG